MFISFDNVTVIPGVMEEELTLCWLFNCLLIGRIFLSVESCHLQSLGMCFRTICKAMHAPHLEGELWFQRKWMDTTAHVRVKPLLFIAVSRSGIGVPRL